MVLTSDGAVLGFGGAATASGDGRRFAVREIEAAPREAGTATLRVGNNLWNYLPKIARTIRVPPAAMLGSWMGTDFTNDDLVKESSLRKDFTARNDRRSDAPPSLVRERSKPR